MQARADWRTDDAAGIGGIASERLVFIDESAVLTNKARRWPGVLSNAVDPGWVRTKMGGQGAPVDLDTGQRTQTWLAVSDEPVATVSGRYWHHLRPEQPARQVMDLGFQDQLIVTLGELTGVPLP